MLIKMKKIFLKIIKISIWFTYDKNNILYINYILYNKFKKKFFPKHENSISSANYIYYIFK